LPALIAVEKINLLLIGKDYRQDEGYDPTAEALMSSLEAEHQQAVIDYATFMVQQYKIQPAEDTRQEPESIARPATESVIAAIKRLKKTYYMLDTDKLLNQTSAMMAKHIMQGQEASTVIDELETTFQTQYQQYLQR